MSSMRKIKQVLTAASALFFVITLSPAMASAAVAPDPTTPATSTGTSTTSGGATGCSSGNLTSQQAIQCGTNGAAGATGNQDATKTLSDTIKTVVNVLSALIGAVAVIMIIIGGFRYVASAGSPEAAKGARNTILYAVIGLVVAALAQVIVHFVLNNVNSA